MRTFDPRARTGRGTRSWIVATIILVQTTQSLAMVGISLFLPLIRSDLGISYSQAGLLTVATTATYAVMQIPAGYLADRFGPKRIFLIGAIGVNALTFGFSVLPSFEWLLANQAVSGVFRSFMFASGMLLVTRQFPPDRKATAMGMFVALGFSSNIFLNIIGPIFVDDIGWRMMFLLFSLLGFVFVAAYFVMPDWDAPSSLRRTHQLRGLLEIIRSRLLWVCGGIQFVRLAVTLATVTWFPTYLVVEKGFELQTAGLVMAIGAALTAPANILGGYFSDRFRRPLTTVTLSLVVVGTTLLLITLVHELPLLIILISINQFFIQIYFGPLFEIPIRQLGAEHAGSINGFSNMCANFGALFAIYVLGWFKDTFDSFDLGLGLLALLCAVSLVLTMVLRRMTSRADEPAVT